CTTNYLSTLTVLLTPTTSRTVPPA
ncbi:MAG: hypothetical protein AVDCRST_MAG12-1080, partial [uncultured Rubrobacteraceae bacterium]